MTPPDNVKRDLERYISFGVKASGSTGDNACGSWLQAELRHLGFEICHQTFSVPYFNARRSELAIAHHTASVIPQGIVVQTSTQGVTGHLVRIDPTLPIEGSLSGAIALVDLPHSRWVSALQKPIRDSVNAAIGLGACAVLIVTNGPTQKAIALNTDGTKPMFNVPVGILAPEQASPFFAAATRGARASFFLTGENGHRDAFNFVGSLDRSQSKWIIVSTPRSGWFTCAGERGPGIAIWLALARWVPDSFPNHNLAFICSSAHEYEYLGADQVIRDVAPRPEVTAIWLALGASIAARDWQSLLPPLLPLPSADPQRYLVVSPTILDIAKHAFSGQSGIESPYTTERFTAGELTPIHNAGYKTVAGFFGAHRFLHTEEDDERCIVVEPTRQAIIGCQNFLRSVIEEHNTSPNIGKPGSRGEPEEPAC
jgi:hypothetical protein